MTHWNMDSLGACRVGVEDHLCPGQAPPQLSALKTSCRLSSLPHRLWEPSPAVRLVAITPVGTEKSTTGC